MNWLRHSGVSPFQLFWETVGYPSVQLDGSARLVAAVSGFMSVGSRHEVRKRSMCSADAVGTIAGRHRHSLVPAGSERPQR